MLSKTLDEVAVIVDSVKILQGQGVPKPTAADAIAMARELRPQGDRQQVF